MTMTLERDTEQPVFFRFTSAPPGPVSVDIDGTWYPLTMEGRVGTLLVAGPDVVDPKPGYVQVTRDCLPRTRDGSGEVLSDGWLRVKAAS